MKIDLTLLHDLHLALDVVSLVRLDDARLQERGECLKQIMFDDFQTCKKARTLNHPFV